jgi:GH3 auxin-responsive promoter
MKEASGLFLANSLWLASGARAACRFRRALKNPRAAQEALLLSLLRRNADTKYGQRYGFRPLRSVRDYQDAVPIVTYDSLEREIDCIKRGDRGVLTHEPVLMMEKTTGSTASAKYIPYTASLKSEFQTAVGAWMTDLYMHRPQMLCGGSYWSVSPLAREREVTVGGLPVGFDDDTEYFGAPERWLLERILLTPPELSRIPDISASRYVTLRLLLETPRLSFISIWNPSFLTLLVHFLWKNQDRLIEDIRRGTLTPPSSFPANLYRLFSQKLRPRSKRADELKRIVRQHGKLLPSLVWTKLAVISCWTHASASLFVPELKTLFPQIEIQPKGLLATEGVVSIPLTGHTGAALAVTSHFLEFVDAENPGARPLLADELDTGNSYSVLITTGGGLYRYRLGDQVQVVGRVHETPLIEFIGKQDIVSDLCGEKLQEAHVRGILGELFGQFQLQPRFALLAPELGQPPSYVLFVEAPQLTHRLLVEMALRLEGRLLENPHYAYCRRLGQLGPARPCLVRNGASQSYLERCAELGQRRGNIKPTALHGKPGWSDWFRVADVEAIPREAG